MNRLFAVMVAVIVLIGLVIALTFLMMEADSDQIIEHLQISGEAVQNVGSIYNTNQMIVELLTANQLRLANGIWTIGADQDQLRIFCNNQQVCAFGKNGDLWLPNLGWIAQTINEMKNSITTKKINIGSWTLQDAGELQFVKDNGGYAVVRPNGDLWGQPTGALSDCIVKGSDVGLFNPAANRWWGDAGFQRWTRESERFQIKPIGSGDNLV